MAKLKCSSPGVVVAVKIGLPWLDDGDTLTSDPTVHCASETKLMVVSAISRPASQLQITNAAGTITATYEQNEWFQYTLTVYRGLADGDQSIDFEVTTTNGETQLVTQEVLIGTPKAT